MTDHGKNEDRGRGGPPRIQIRVQTPRGLWSMAVPEDAPKRPDYPLSEKVQQVVDDARDVYKFIEADNKYSLFFGDEALEPQRTLVSYHIEQDALLTLSVQGGNA